MSSRSTPIGAVAGALIAGVAISILFSFLLTVMLDDIVKSDWLKNNFGIEVNLNDGLKPEEYLPGIKMMVALWLLFALMRIVHHNVDFWFSMAIGALGPEAKDILTMGGYKSVKA